MRLAMSFFILVVTVLNFQFGQTEFGLQLANMVAGMLLALSVIVDHLLPMTSPVSPSTTRPEATQADPTRTTP
jgi:hypothetical protein